MGSELRHDWPQQAPSLRTPPLLLLAHFTGLLCDLLRLLGVDWCRSGFCKVADKSLR
jgi:hypothetical protein